MRLQSGLVGGEGGRTGTGRGGKKKSQTNPAQIEQVTFVAFMHSEKILLLP